MREEVRPSLGRWGGERSLLGVRHWAFVIMGVVAIGLLPWTAYLSVTLPPRHESVHWDIVWPGFDIGLALAIGATVIALVRCSGYLPILASVAGALLLCDAWFDTLTSQPGTELAWATVEALLAELPLAAFCFWLAVDAESVALARRLMGRSGTRPERS